MAQESLALREWLTDEVKLERYFDKLVSHGYDSLRACCSIDENVLDEITITPPYHRKRLLKYVEDLRQRLHDNQPGNETTESPVADGHVESTVLGSEAFALDDEGNADEIDVPPLPPKLTGKNPTCEGSGRNKSKPLVPSRVSSMDMSGKHVTESLESLDSGNSQLMKLNCDQRNTERGSAKSPPPIPPRTDLVEERAEERAEDSELKADEGVGSHVQASAVDSVSSVNSTCAVQDVSTEGSVEAGAPVLLATSKKSKPVKPPRRNAPKLPDSFEPSCAPQALAMEVSQRNCSQSTASAAHVGGELLQDTEDKNLYVNASPVPVSRPVPKPPIRASTYPLSSGKHPASPRHTLESETTDASSSISAKEASSVYVNMTSPQQDKPTQSTQMKRPIPKPRRTITEKRDNLNKKISADDQNRPMSPLRPTSVLFHQNPEAGQAFMNVLNKKIGSKKYPKILSLDRRPIPVTSSNLPGNDSTYEYVGLPEGGKGRVASPPPKKMAKEDSIYDEVGVASQTPERGHVNSPDNGVHEGIRKPHSDSDISRDTLHDGSESDDSLDADIVADVIISEPTGSSTTGDGVDSSQPMIQIPKVRRNEGYLFKQGGQQNNKGWRRRWFVFDGKDLRYYKDKESMKETLHVIPVSQMKNLEFVTDARRATFNLITANRVFMLASEDRTDMTLWAQTLLEAILQFKGDETQHKPGGATSNPDMEGWLKKQGHNVVADWKRRYVAIKKDKISYYDSYEDFVYDTKINCIQAALSKVKTVDGHKNRFQIYTPYKTFCFQAENESEAGEWIVAIEEAIQEGLADREVVNKVWENPYNKQCADCGKKDPVWASINFCVCVCAQCIGVHRNLGVHLSKARSLLMDERVWNPSLIQLMVRLGNANVNKLLEFKMPEDDKIMPKTDKEKRTEFILSKYRDKKYIKFHQEFGNLDALGMCLRENVKTDNLMLTMELIINKANIRYVPSESQDKRTPLDLAREAGQELQVELLRQNGGDQAKIETQISMDDLSEDWSSRRKISEITPRESYEKEGFLHRKETRSVPYSYNRYNDERKQREEEISLEGVNYKDLWKHGNVHGWKKRWFMLKDRQLRYSRTPHDKDEMGAIDLRTVTSLVVAPNDNSLLLDVVTTDRTHSLKAETEEDIESWYNKLRSKQVFNVLLSEQSLGSDGIPHLVAKCVQFVETYGGLEMEGIYRVSGSQAKIKELRLAFNQDAGGKLLTLDECGVHDITGTLKLYLRELPDPVIPSAMYKQFLNASLVREATSRLQTLKVLISSLPKANHATLKSIVGHLTKVVSFQTVNKMGVPNVSLIFGPTLMSNTSTGEMSDLSITNEVKIISEMIMKYQFLFDVKDEEIKKDEAIQNALEKMRKCEEMLKSEDKVVSPGVKQEFTLDIYIKRKDDTPFRMKVNSNMTAGTICMEIVQQRNLEKETHWALFEVIRNGSMERAFQVREKVLSSVMSWEGLGMGTQNFLVVKENYIAEQTAPYLATLNMEGQLQIRDPKKKDWKLSTVELKNGFIGVDKGKSFFKSIKSDLDYWPLYKLTLYVGVNVEKQSKGVDTSCGFTVVVKTDQEDIVRFMCAKDKVEMNRWVAAILNMKHPEGIWSDPSQSRRSYFSDDHRKRANYKKIKSTNGVRTTMSKREELPVFLGRQSTLLRRQGSSRPIAEEIQMKRQSLRRPMDKPSS